MLITTLVGIGAAWIGFMTASLSGMDMDGSNAPMTSHPFKLITGAIRSYTHDTSTIAHQLKLANNTLQANLVLQQRATGVSQTAMAALRRTLDPQNVDNCESTIRIVGTSYNAWLKSYDSTIIECTAWVDQLVQLNDTMGPLAKFKLPSNIEIWEVGGEEWTQRGYLLKMALKDERWAYDHCAA